MLLAINLLVLVGTAIWVAIDARDRDFSSSKFARSRAQWVVGALGLWIVALPTYLIVRGKYPKGGAAGGPMVTPPVAGPPPNSGTSVAPPGFRG